MTDPLIVAFVSAGSAVLASLLTIFLTPRLQHHFWKRQRRAELRLTVINDFSKVISVFDTKFDFDKNYIPTQDKEFWQLFIKSVNEINTLFPRTFKAFNELQASMDATEERRYGKFTRRRMKS